MWGKGLLAPIITLLVVIALSTLLIGHWIGMANLQQALEAREKDRLIGIQSMIKTLIGTEVSRLTSLSHVLRKNPVLAQAMADHNSFGEAAIRVILDDLYQNLNVEILTATDARGHTIHSSGTIEEWGDLSALWGMDEALDGQELVSTDRGTQGFVIRTISPLFQGRTVIGTIIVGNRIDDRFAGQLAAETGSQIFFGTADEVIASSVPAGNILKIDKELVKHSLLDKKPTFVLDWETKTLRYYAPVAVVDNHFCLILESDLSQMFFLIERSRWRMLWVSTLVLLLMVVIGSLTAIRLTRPLSALRQKAEVLIGEYSQQGLVIRGRGNEVETLVCAFDAMVSAMRGYIVAGETANEQLEKARAELDERVRLRTTELTEANEQLSRAKEAAESANRAKTEFLAKMSHELRTPLHQVMGFTELAMKGQDDTLSEKQKRYLSLSIQSSGHLLSLVNDILDISKIEAGKSRLQLSKVNLLSLIEESLVMVRDKAVKSNISTSLTAGGIPETISADERMLRQVLYNLLSNALKFTGEGGSIRLRASSIDWVSGPLQGSDGKWIHPPAKVDGETVINTGFIEVAVADTGVGIREEDLEKIFNPFEQIDFSLPRRLEGTGLGLALTRGFVELHGGRIWAESEGLGKGSTFRFVIPVS